MAKSSGENWAAGKAKGDTVLKMLIEAKMRVRALLDRYPLYPELTIS